MYEDKSSKGLYALLGFLALVLSVSLTGAAVQPTRAFSSQALAINYGNCSLLYAVQPGDTLNKIAQAGNTTTALVLSRNNLSNADDLFPGLILCLETAGNGGTVPPGRERSGVEVTNVSTDETVTVAGRNFTPGADVNVYMFQFGVSNPNVARLGTITIPAQGTFNRSFQIPAALRSFRNLIIRFRNPDENISATTTFMNANVSRVSPNDCAEYYTVRSGDVLGVIAQEQNVTVERLVAINNLLNANVVFPGQLLCVSLK